MQSNILPLKKTRFQELLKPIAIFYFLCGFFVFIPIEIYPGLHVGYLIVVIVFLLSEAFNRWFFLIWLLFSCVVLISFVNSDISAFLGAVNPIICSLAMLINLRRATVLSISNGALFAGCSVGLALIYLSLGAGFESLSEVILSRNWAKDDIVFFNNGLGMSFALGMLIAYQRRFYYLVFVLGLGGFLTTSRIPMFSALILYSCSLYKIVGAKRFLIFSASIFLVFFAIYADEISRFIDSIMSVSGRLLYVDDRLVVYQRAIEMFVESPFFGAGSEKIEYYEHAHNSFLQVLYRFGFFAFLLYLAILFYFFRSVSLRKNGLLYFFFISVSMPQLGLLNSNIVLLLCLAIFLARNKAWV